MPQTRAGTAGGRHARHAEPAGGPAAAGPFVIVTKADRRPVQDSPPYRDLGAANVAADRANLRAGATGPVYEVVPASGLTEVPGPEGLA